MATLREGRAGRVDLPRRLEWAVLAGGPQAMFKAGEGVEDDRASARRDLERVGLNRKDVLVGIAASGRTPYTLEGLRYDPRAALKGCATTMDDQ